MHKFCPECGAQLSETGRFCAGCGASRDGSTPAVNQFPPPPMYPSSSTSSYTQQDVKKKSWPVRIGLVLMWLVISVFLCLLACLFLAGIYSFFIHQWFDGRGAGYYGEKIFVIVFWPSVIVGIVIGVKRGNANSGNSHGGAQ